MSKLYVCVALLFLSACGPGEPKYIDPAFLPILNTFKQYANNYGKIYDYDISITFVDKFDSPNVVGTCTGNDEIRIRRSFWENVNYYQQEDVLYHELGHCVMNLDHVTTPSIMNAKTLQYWYYVTYREELIKELFTGTRNREEAQNNYYFTFGNFFEEWTKDEDHF